MVPAALISAKRDGRVLREDEIRFMIDGFTAGTIPDYQMSAWAMAVLCRGMNAEEIAALTDAMTASGTRLLRASERPRVDKHSTGGLGDKTSLILAPLLACCDLDVPMLSGRGLGITGGTLDKLEAFPSYRCDLTEAEIDRQLKQIGCAITGTTPRIAPADRKLYALRDVTGTVPSIALITASIMSKKLAESLDALVLDVKFGSGAFMRQLADARLLASSLVATGLRMNVPTRAILSDMNQPLGHMVGNACEVNESIDVLEGRGPADVRGLTLTLAAQLLVATRVSADLTSAMQKLSGLLDSGAALDRFQQMVEHQSGQFSRRLMLAPCAVFQAIRGGYIGAIDGQLIGQSVIELGGGRQQLGDQINHRVGLEMLVRVGDVVQPRQPLLNMFYDSAPKLERARRVLERAIAIHDDPVQPLELVIDR